MRRELSASAVVILALLGGCYVDPGVGGKLAFDGDIQVEGGRFEMNGTFEFRGGKPPQDTYENVTLELYAEDGTLLYQERVGTIDDPSDEIRITVSLSVVPEYVIFDSPDIWDGKTSVDYYVRSGNKYGYHGATERSELPIQPDG